MRRRFSLCGFALLVTTPAWCQEDPVFQPVLPPAMGVIDFGIQRVRQHREVIEGQQRERWKRYLELRIDEMDRVCGLSDAQRKKLQVAVKGAVEQATEAYRAAPQSGPAAAAWAVAGDGGAVVVQGHFGNGILVPQPAVPNLEVRPAGEEAPRDAGSVEPPEPAREPAGAERPVAPADDVEAFRGLAADPPAAVPVPPRAAVAAGAVQPIVVEWVPGLAGGFRDGLVESQPAWGLAAKNVLTDEQLQRYREVHAERNAFRLRAAAELFVAALDAELLLDAEQRPRLADLAMACCGDELVGPLGRTEQFLGSTVWSLAGRLPERTLRELLSEPQFARWRHKSAEAEGQWAAPLPALPVIPQPVPAADLPVGPQAR